MHRGTRPACFHLSYCAQMHTPAAPGVVNNISGAAGVQSSIHRVFVHQSNLHHRTVLFGGILRFCGSSVEEGRWSVVRLEDPPVNCRFVRGCRILVVVVLRIIFQSFYGFTVLHFFGLQHDLTNSDDDNHLKIFHPPTQQVSLIDIFYLLVCGNMQEDRLVSRPTWSLCADAMLL